MKPIRDHVSYGMLDPDEIEDCSLRWLEVQQYIYVAVGTDVAAGK